MSAHEAASEVGEVLAEHGSGGAKGAPEDVRQLGFSQRLGELIVEVADGVKVRVLRGMIAESLSKSEAAPAKSKKDQTEDEQDYDEAEDEYDEDENVDIEQDKKD